MNYDSDLLILEDDKDHLIEAIYQSQVYQNYLAAYQAFQQDLGAQQQKARFLLAKQQFDAIASYGAYAPDYKKYQRELRKEKRALDMIPSVIELRASEYELQQLFDCVAETIAQSVSDQINVISGQPFLKHQCQGGCQHGASI